MPVYEYLCDAHGPFEALRPMAEFAAPCACPDCGAESPRVLLTAPRLAGADRGAIRAGDINARSADTPKKLSTHGPGCGCCSGESKKSSGTLKRPDGSKSFPAKRPWMISH